MQRGPTECSTRHCRRTGGETKNPKDPTRGLYLTRTARPPIPAVARQNVGGPPGNEQNEFNAEPIAKPLNYFIRFCCRHSPWLLLRSRGGVCFSGDGDVDLRTAYGRALSTTGTVRRRSSGTLWLIVTIVCSPRRRFRRLSTCDVCSGRRAADDRVFFFPPGRYNNMFPFPLRTPADVVITRRRLSFVTD